MIQDDEYWLKRLDDTKEKSKEELENFWLDKFSGDLTRYAFHYDYKETVSNVRLIDSVEFRFSRDVYSKLRNLCLESEINLYLTLASGLVILLGKYSYTATGMKDIIVGTPVLFKQRKDDKISLANTVLAVRNRFDENITFNDLCARVGETILEANEYKNFPVEELADRLNMKVFGDDFPLFDVAFSLENIQDRRYIRHFNVNLIFSFFKTGKYIDGVVEYNSSLYEKTTIKKIINQFTNLLESALSNVHAPLYMINIFSGEDKKKLLEELNNTKEEYPKDKTIQEIFESRVEEKPDSIALIFQDCQLTYRELNERAILLAGLLRDKGIKPDMFAGLMVERSLDMIIGMFGILKSGGAYLPIDPEYPEDRIFYLLRDSGSKFLLTQEKFIGHLTFNGEIIRLDMESSYAGKNRSIKPVNTPLDLAYSIYTSGSTGKPKGVMIEHWSVINLAYSQKTTFCIEESDRVLQFSSISFDASVEQIYITLFSGAALVLIDKMTLLDMKRFEKFIDDQDLAHIHAVPLFVGNIPVKKYVGLKRMIAGGDVCPPSLVQQWIKYCDFCNEYGPTETTVTSIQLMVNKSENLQELSIGKALNNTFLYILGKNNELAPIGVPGELCIGGDGVARGYMNRPELTAEKFIHLILNINTITIYKTGDLARWLPDGNIDFLGRIDFQVKIRGFRIETGEIENQILTHEEQRIKEAVVIAREDSGGEKYLCAYLIADNPIDIKALTEKISKNLPDYMIPSYFVQIDKIPLTSSGKMDRKALPDPQLKAMSESYIAPRNETETSLAEIWSEVLHIKKDIISIDDNFFRLGGHSLKAAVMINLIHKKLNVKLKLLDIFEMFTIKDLGRYIGGSKEEKYSSIPKTRVKEFYPQTSSQKRLYFIDQLEKDNTVYNMQMMDVYCKGIDRENLKEAFKKLFNRHESLRTSFHTIEGEAVQKIHSFEEVVSNFEIEYWETAEDGMIYSEEPGKEWTRVTGLPFKDVLEHFVRPFDLSKAPILRAGLIKIWEKTQILMIDMHHIMSDGVSEVILIKDLWAFYDGEELPGLEVQYKDFAVWFSGEEQQKEIEKQETFWLNEFKGEIPILNMPYDFSRPPKLSFDGDFVHFEISKEVSKRINAMAQELGVTTYMILFAAYNILLAKLSGQEEIVIGTVTAGRGHADIQNIIGMFVDTLAIRNFPTSNRTFSEFLQEVKKKTLTSFENQDYPFERLVGKVAQRKDTGRNPLFDVVFSWENEAERTEEYLLEVLMLDKSSPYSFNVKKTKFDMVLVGIEGAEDLGFNLEYSTQLFKQETIDRFVMYYKKILYSICKNIDIKISGIEIMPDLERGILLYSFNDTESEYPKDKTIHELFESQVANTSDNIAVSGKTYGKWGMELTYKGLNSRANQLARVLRTKGMKPENIAAIIIDPCQEMMIGLLAILKAGGAFLPIKDGTPLDRMKYILKESGTRFLLTRKELLEGIVFDGQIIELDNDDIYKEDEENLSMVNSPLDLAYIIYTSGSTGKPKGVMVEHCALANLCFWHNKYYSVTSKDHATKYAGFGFDASVWEIFPYLVIGAAIYIIPEDIKLDIKTLHHYFQDNNITISFLPTQVCEQFMTIEDTSLRILLTGGDKLKTFIKKNYRLYNNYGPTENTVVATSFLVTGFASNIPIGRPLYNNQIYIVDKNIKLQPIGVPGELCIGGDSLSRGYLNNSKLTEEKFIESPFKYTNLWSQSSKLYRTGDLVRWLPDGNIEFLGRIDYQVKIRGFRIELGEIENQLLHLEDVDETVVIARDDTAGQKYLCAYIVSDKAVEISSLREALARKLPDYMIPSFFVHIEKIPLTPNGKIDTKALLEPEIKGIEYVAPTNEIENILVLVWSEVLGIKKIGIDDNFFEIGGDSIKTILISSKLLKQQLSSNVNDFFSHPTIRRLAKYVKKTERVISQGIVSGNVELTPIQKWFFENHLLYSHHFNQSVLAYRKARFNETFVKKVFTRIVEHHDALRMVYRLEKDTVTQENKGIDVKLFDLETILLIQKEKDAELEEIKKEANRIQRSIDLQTGPLVKIGLFKGIEGDHLLMVIHHAVVDGVSWRILLEDFETGYKQAERGDEIKFQDKTDSFKHWSQKLSEYSGSNSLLNELLYWEKIEAADVKHLRVDHEIGKEERIFKNNEFIPMILSEEKTTQLMSKTNWAYNTEINDVLLTALGLTVKQWAGLDNVLVKLEGHGREQIIDDANINRTVGWFTSMYPVLLNMKKSEDISFAIKNVKETLRRIPNKGIGYGILKYLTPPGNKESIRFKHTPEIVFNYLGEFGEEKYDIIDSMSEISAPETGDSIPPDYLTDYKIDIEGVIAEGKLNLYFFYNIHEYERKTIDNLAALLNFNLVKLIDHCREKEEKELTPSDFGYSKLSIEDLERITGYIKGNISKDAEIQLMYSLSPMQSGMLFHSIKSKTSNAYFEQSEFTIHEELDQTLMEESVNKLIERYDILRTVFAYEELEEPVQIVLRERKAELYYEDIARLNGEEQKAYIEVIKRKDKQRGFELSRDLLIRIILFKTEPGSNHIIMSFHHTLMDGWCLGIIFKELSQLYYSLKENALIELEPVAHYVHYIRWLEKQDKQEGLRYWQKYLEGYDVTAVLPKLGHIVKEDEYKLEEYHSIIDETLTAGMNKISRENQVTINTVFQTIWGILLQKYNNCNDAVYGTIVSGRPAGIECIDRMVGLFINMIPVRVKNSEEQLFSELLKDVQVKSVSSKPYEYLSIAEIQAATFLKGGLIDHIMVFENYPIEEEIKNPGEKRKQVFTVEGMQTSEQTNYDFNIIIIPWKHFIINFNYNGLVYDWELIERVALHIENVVRQLVDNQNIDVKEIEIITGKEKNKILFKFNDTKADYPTDKTIQELFEDRVERTPSNIAIKFKEDTLTYREVNERANRLARTLRNKGAHPDNLVGIVVERSFEMIIGIFAIIKAGGAYLPIDPHYPEDRIRYLFKDSSSKLLLTQAKHAEFARTVEFDGEALNLNDESLYQGESKNIENVNSPNNLAYVIYTSGSTGKPKGVVIEHIAAVNVILTLDKMYPLEKTDAYLLKTAFLFDVSVSEIFGWFWRGGRLVILEQGGEKDPMLMFEIINEEKITHLNFVPSMFNLFVDLLSPQNVNKLNCLKYIFLAGEAIWPDSIIKFRALGTHVIIENLYGPTEAAVYASWYSVSKWESVGSVSIGRPIDNLKLYILGTDEKFRNGMHPVGIPGELCISGIQLTRGYLNRPELNDKMFVDNPFAGQEGINKYFNKMYRTGDLTRWYPDGNIEYMGRIDHQVKVRGFRIELGEIESEISKIPEIKEGVVLAREAKDRPGEKYLCAYLVSDKAIDIASVRKNLAEELPEYMIPSYFVQIEKLPLNPSGKIDRKVLPEPGMESVTKEYVAPTNEIEQALAEVWAKVLGIEKVSIDTNFFEMGGDSIKTILVSGRMMKRHFKLNVNDIFSNKTIRNVARYVKKGVPEIISDDASRDEKLIEMEIKKDYEKYLEKVKKEEWPDITRKNDYKSILLSGATGYLGANLLNELLNSTEAILYLPVRGTSQMESVDRLKKKITFYFGNNFFNKYKERIIILRANLGENRLGMTEAEYEKLCEKVDAVAHSAASVKHYGSYEELHKDNVEGTEQLLEFSATGKKKDFHFISTMDSGSGKIPGKDYLLYTEYSQDDGQLSDNVYIRSKFEAEKRVRAYREKGINTSIFRISNITFDSETGRFQENIENNFFYSMLKAFVKVGFWSEKMRALSFDLSFVDYVATSIVFLMTRDNLKNETYHICNPYTLTWKDMTKLINELSIELPNMKVVDKRTYLSQFEGNQEYEKIIERVELYSWIWEVKPETITIPKIDRTVMILKMLGFEWPKVNKTHIKKMIAHCKEVGFL